jgi:hypothetical protein
MEITAVAEILRTRFIGFRGSETELLREMFAHSNPGALRDVPSNPRAFRTALKTIAPELVALGVSLTIFDSGMIHVTSSSAAQKDASEESALRASFFNMSLPESATLRSEFGNSEQGFLRFAAYRRGLSKGQIHEPRRGTNALAAEDKAHAAVDTRLPIEEQCRQRWNLEPAVRSEFRSFDAFLAYEKAHSRGQVRQFAPGA